MTHVEAMQKVVSIEPITKDELRRVCGWPAEEFEQALDKAHRAAQSAPGHLRKLWMVLLLGRACFIRFSRPLAVRTLVDQQGASERTAHTLERVARVHFHRTRLMATGPQLADRALLFEQILRAPLVAKAMAEECSNRNQSPTAVKAQAMPSATGARRWDTPRGSRTRDEGGASISRLLPHCTLHRACSTQ